MAIAALGLYSQAIILFAALALFTSFIMLAQARMMPLIFTFAWQGLLLAVVSVLVAIVSKHPDLYVSAAPRGSTGSAGASGGPARSKFRSGYSGRRDSGSARWGSPAP